MNYDYMPYVVAIVVIVVVCVICYVEVIGMYRSFNERGGTFDALWELLGLDGIIGVLKRK